MIAAGVVEHIRQLLDQGEVSQRRIARQLGVSRGTVNAIAQGRRRDCPTASDSDPLGFVPPQGVPRRCPGCGGLVQMPCLLCRLTVCRPVMVSRQKSSGAKRRHICRSARC